MHCKHVKLFILWRFENGSTPVSCNVASFITNCLPHLYPLISRQVVWIKNPSFDQASHKVHELQIDQRVNLPVKSTTEDASQSRHNQTSTRPVKSCSWRIKSTLGISKKIFSCRLFKSRHIRHKIERIIDVASASSQRFQHLVFGLSDQDLLAITILLSVGEQTSQHGNLVQHGRRLFELRERLDFFDFDFIECNIFVERLNNVRRIRSLCLY